MAEAKEKALTYYARIDEVEVLPNGSISVEKSDGTDPPGNPSGSALVYPSRAEFVAALEEAEAAIGPILFRLKLAKAYKADPTLGVQFKTLAKAGPVSVLDLTGVAITLTV